MNALFNERALRGRVALVTGASRGIGRAVAAALADAGATVIGTATTTAGAERVSELLADHGRGAVLEVSDRAAGAALVEGLTAEFGRLDILVNNAGVTRDALALRLGDEAWDEVLRVDLAGAFALTRAALRPMLRARWGRIVCMSSVVAAMGNPGQANYAAAKAGLIAMSRSVAREVASRGITVNCVAPGFIETDMTAALPPERRAALAAGIPAARLGRPEDVAAATLFLVSEAAAYITGAVIPVNGGLFMG